MQHNNQDKESPKDKALRQLQEAEEKRAELRFKRGFFELENDRFDILINTEFKEKLADYFSNQRSEDEINTIESVLDKLFEQIDNSKYSSGIHDILDRVCHNCQKGYNLRLFQYLVEKYIQLLDESDANTLISENLCNFLSHACGMYVRSSRWVDFEKLINVLWKVRNLNFQTPDGRKKPFQDIFNAIATKDVIEKILQFHNVGNKEEKKLASHAMRYLGEDALVFLLNRLVFSKTKAERFLLIDLIASLGEEIIDPIQKFMDVDLPWYAVRNLIILISEIGNPDFYHMVEGFLIHPDIRVQQQVVACIVKLGGENLEKRLMQALPVVEDEIKLKLVMQLGDYHSEEIANGLLDIIYKREMVNEAIRDELLYKICITLRSFPYTKVINLLKHLQKERVEQGHGKDKLAIATQETINRLEPQVRHLAKLEKTDAPDVDFDAIVAETIGDEDANVVKFLEDIEELLQVGNLEKATAIMYKKIIDTARAKQFTTAETLRDKLLEINPDALQDVIRAAEIIEEEKSSPTTSVQAEIWDDLYARLSTDEYDAFLSLLRTENYKKDERIVGTDEIDPCLYFLSSGAVRLSCLCGQHETFLKRLKPGEVLGVGPFFSASVWTVNLTALQKTSLQVLRRQDFMKMEKLLPDLEEKLLEFCSKKDIIPDLIKMSGRDRRDCARYPVNITVNHVLLDPYGDSSGRRVFHGEMIDISRGGLSFSIRISKKENAHLLLGRQIISEIKLKNKEVLKCFGLIVGVNYQHEIVKEYSVHVKFYSELGQHQVSNVVNLVM